MSIAIGMIGIGGFLFAYGLFIREADNWGARAAWLLFGLLMIVIVLADGGYWAIFPRGHGWWTANRISAGAVYLALMLGPWAVSALRRAR